MTSNTELSLSQQMASVELFREVVGEVLLQSLDQVDFDFQLLDHDLSGSSVAVRTGKYAVVGIMTDTFRALTITDTTNDRQSAYCEASDGCVIRADIGQSAEQRGQTSYGQKYNSLSLGEALGTNLQPVSPREIVGLRGFLTR